MLPPIQLVIGIPTYNRARKLRRVLALFCDQIAAAGLQASVFVQVSDNASTDETPAVCAEFLDRPDAVRVLVHRQANNLGFNGNVWWLYTHCTAAYLWTFADDDIPLPGAVEKVYRELVTRRPDFLMFSFAQPPDSPHRTFDLPDPVTSVRDRGQMARLVCAFPKISLYVYRKVDLGPGSVTLLTGQINQSGYAYTALALSILEEAAEPELVIIAEQLAACDEDFNVLRISPYDWGRSHQMWDHPFVRQWAPAMAASALRNSYLNQLGFLWSWRAGGVSVEPEYVDEWWEAIHTLQPAWRWLARSPGALVRFSILKTAPATVPRMVNATAAHLRGYLHRVLTRTADKNDPAH